MTIRKKNHLIYLDSEGYSWMQEHGVGAEHPNNAQFFCEVPSHDDPRWLTGKPNISNMQFATLSPFFPTQRLDISIEINREPKIMNNVNHPAFEGCVKYMPIHLLDFQSIPKHISRVIHTIGACHYGHTEPYKTVDVSMDDKIKSIDEGIKLLNISTVEHVKYVGVKPNHAYDEYYNKKPKLKL